MSFVTNIRQLRRRAELSQQNVADAVGIARATYIKLENGGRQPKLDELKKLSQYYEIGIEVLVDGVDQASNEPATPHRLKAVETEIMPRDTNPQTNPEKLRAVLLYVLEKVGAKPNVGETVLYKLLYFIDFDYYEKTGQSITGLTYVRNHFGPTPTRSFQEVVAGMKQQGELEIVETKFFDNLQRKYLPTTKSDLRELGAKEIKHIDDTLDRLSNKTASELSQLSHKDTPWRVAKQGKPIDYRFVFYRTDQTAVTEPEDEL